MSSVLAELRFVTCQTGKVPHPTHASAEYEAIRMNAKITGNKPSQPYMCPYCMQWHIGRGPKK